MERDAVAGPDAPPAPASERRQGLRGLRAYRLQGLLLAAGSGILYGSVNVAAKPIDAHPFWKAAIAYTTSFALLAPFLRGFKPVPRDIPLVLAMGFLGGGLAPVLLFYGLQQASATDAGLLLCLEMVATAAFAALWLGERFHGRELVGLGLLLLAGTFVALAGGVETASTATGLGLIALSAIAWGVDNTVSARLVGGYKPHQLIAVKGGLGAAFALTAALVARAPLPAWPAVGGMAAIGLGSVACSSLLFYHALRRVGAGRTSAMNIGTTGLVGALGGIVLLHERLVWLHAAALAALLAGAFALAGHRAGAPEA